MKTLDKPYAHGYQYLAVLVWKDIFKGEIHKLLTDEHLQSILIVNKLWTPIKQNGIPQIAIPSFSLDQYWKKLTLNYFILNLVH